MTLRESIFCLDGGCRPFSDKEGYGWAKYFALGTELAVSVIAGLYLGSLVDKWLGTRGPWFTLLGLLVGMISGFTLLLRMLKKSGEDRGD